MVVVAVGLPMFSEKSATAAPPPPPDGLIVMERTADPVPPVLVAEMVTLVVPATVGVPVIAPVAVLITSPVGRLVAANEVGMLDAVIW